MKTRLFIILLLCLPTAFSFAQVDPFAALDSTFNAYVNQMDEDYDRRIEEMDEDFYKYLGMDWEEFQMLEAVEKPAFGKGQITSVSFGGIQKNPVYPRKKNATYLSKSFTFYEEAVNIKIDAKTYSRLASISEKEIAEGWKRLAATDFYATLKDCYDIKSRLRLNDWGVFLFFAQLSDKIYSSALSNERTLFTAFMLTHAGYDIKLARSGNISDTNSRLIMLLPFHSEVYQKQRTKIDGKYYYIESLANDVKIKNLDIYKVKKVFSYRKNFELAIAAVNLSLPTPPVLGQRLIRKEIKTPSSAKEKVGWRKGLTDFYNAYPETELAIYLNTPMSKELKTSLEPIVASLIDKDDKVKSVQNILTWFYHSFPYKLDKKQQTLFPEQTVLYPYSDCEDRSILFAHIVREFIGLDAVLFQFEEHIATGIAFDKPIDGFSYIHKKRKYTACDPSSRYCRIGFITEIRDKHNLSVIELIK